MIKIYNKFVIVFFIYILEFFDKISVIIIFTILFPAIFLRTVYNKYKINNSCYNIYSLNCHKKKEGSFDNEFSTSNLS